MELNKYATFEEALEGCGGLPKRHTREWYDGCVYKCQLCQFVCIKFYTLRSHVRKNHKSESTQDIIRESLVYSEKYTCQLCLNHTEVIKDKKNIDEHLGKVHTTNCKEYGKYFEPQGKENMSEAELAALAGQFNDAVYMMDPNMNKKIVPVKQCKRIEDTAAGNKDVARGVGLAAAPLLGRAVKTQS